jgi:septal ring factor EnvC (AmiA/AmiB activator)
VAECPRCGTEVATASKSWPVHFGKPQQGRMSQLAIGIFECPQCKTKFRSRMKTSAQQTSPPNVRELVDRIKGIREGFLLTLATLREKISTLEKERSTLLAEAEELRRAAESRANALESEVSQLRQEIKSLKEVLDSASVG